jgi:hypothetical protein
MRVKGHTMTQADYQHDYSIGDAVLAHIDDVEIPGVVEDKQDGKLLVRLAEPWVDETGRRSDEAWLTPDQLDASIAEETGGTEALPG